ncbi:MAG: hypothetical protein IJV14_11080 [Lachnospiraceae bacterium]|nr:hypothetical protein [Lachnospiraceae bacterium]
MKLTSFFKLRKPEGKDPVDIEDFNYNFDEIDAALNDAANKAGDLSEGKVFTSVASSRSVPNSGETLAGIISKIMRYLSDLGNAAYCNVANNDTTTAANYVADARRVTQLRTDFTAFKTSFQAGCKKIANAITGGRDGSGTGGVTTAENASPDTMATNIKTLAQNNYNAAKVGTAAKTDVIAGKTFTNSTTVGETGSLPDYRENVQSVTPTESGGTKSGTVLDGSGTWYEDLNIPNGAHKKVRVNKHTIYRKGAADADNRVNTNSASYRSGKTDANNIVSGNIVYNQTLSFPASGSHAGTIAYTATQKCIAFVVNTHAEGGYSSVTNNGCTSLGNGVYLMNSGNSLTVYATDNSDAYASAYGRLAVIKLNV